MDYSPNKPEEEYGSKVNDNRKMKACVASQ